MTLCAALKRIHDKNAVAAATPRALTPGLFPVEAVKPADLCLRQRREQNLHAHERR